MYVTMVKIWYQINSLRNSGVKGIGNKILKQFENFSIPLGNMLAKNIADESP